MKSGVFRSGESGGDNSTKAPLLLQILVSYTCLCRGDDLRALFVVMAVGTETVPGFLCRKCRRGIRLPLCLIVAGDLENHLDKVSIRDSKTFMVYWKAHKHTTTAAEDGKATHQTLSS